MISVLFVCSGNICRSPTAEGVFRSLLEAEGLTGEVIVDSAGTHGWHAGEPPDPRAQAAARRRGIELGRLRARSVTLEDFARFDYIIAMDDDHRRQLEGACPPDARGRIQLMMDFAPDYGRREVPDPYYGGDEGFEHVLDMIEAAAAGLLAEIRARR